jgi:hypothetical protein
MLMHLTNCRLLLCLPSRATWLTNRSLTLLFFFTKLTLHFQGWKHKKKHCNFAIDELGTGSFSADTPWNTEMRSRAVQFSGNLHLCECKLMPGKIHFSESVILTIWNTR